MYDSMNAAPNVPESNENDPRIEIMEKYKKLDQMCDEIIKNNKLKKLTIIKK